MKIISFNVNGIRAIAQKDFFEDMNRVNPDVICLQETKATVEQVKDTVKSLSAYEVYANEANKKGYSGTAILTKRTPISISYDIDIEEHDQEGRVTSVEFDNYFLVTVYTPNSGGELARLPYRKNWDAAFLDYLKQLETKKPVLVCGDLNVAHKDIDLARPKANYNKSAGYMQYEIDGMDSYHQFGIVDTFRVKYPEEIKYTWWSYRGGARDKNVGWRIDYFLASQNLLSKVVDAFVLNDVYGSDHCPVGVIMEE